MAAACSSAPESGTPIHDPLLVEALKPTKTSSARLFRGSDGKCYFRSDGLGDLSLSQYASLLERRGIVMDAFGGAMSSPVGVVNQYVFRFMVRAKEKPFSVDLKEISDSDPRRPSRLRSLLQIKYAGPITKSGAEVAVRLGESCANAWEREVVVPSADVEPLPFGIPRPGDAVVRSVQLSCGPSDVRKLGESLPPTCQVIVRLVSDRPPVDVLRAWASSVAGLGSVDVDETSRAGSLTTKVGTPLEKLNVQLVTIKTGVKLHARDLTVPYTLLKGLEAERARELVIILFGQKGARH